MDEIVDYNEKFVGVIENIISLVLFAATFIALTIIVMQRRKLVK